MIDPKSPVWEEYDDAASWCAERGIAGNDGDPLPDNLSADCFWAINDDPEAFAERIRATAYARSMEAHNSDTDTEGGRDD